ncbi:D-aspartate oxidase [Hylaeus anthracinus]|uniref:D-aspartate oxidase n=1 Tax=Hylaeus anthracinus TaxID=313031 RepID=UPI0023B92E82|nr:D-aspartate oxidase [Hylaeus anthracinus]
MRVAVVGAGVIGTTTAFAVKTAFPRLQVHVLADQFSPDTTGDGSAGLWGPYLLGDTPSDKILAWAGATHRWLENFWKSGQASETGVSLVPVCRVTSDPKGYIDSSWTKLVYGAHKLTAKELEKLNEEHKSNYKEGWTFVTFTSEPVRLLPWLKEKFLGLGGEVRRRKVHALHELIDDGYDLIINCSGLGARELANDNTLVPIRGQVARVTASWAMHGHLVDDEDSYYIIPNIDTTILGGTHQENDFDCTPREEDSRSIYDGCCRIMPALEAVTPSEEWVGLRPGRPSVRLEAEVLRSPRGKNFTVIHNYGHGGSGVTLSWGCALDVVAILRQTWRPNSNL